MVIGYSKMDQLEIVRLNKMSVPKIDETFIKETLRMIRESDLRSNRVNLKRIIERGYIERAVVLCVTKCADYAIVDMRADGVTMKVKIALDSVDDLYENPARYAEAVLLC